MANNYGAEAITVLEGLEAVRKRPGMYIGSTSSRGLHHLVWEIVDNSVDEALAGVCDKITVKILEGNIIEVTDNGRGIPVGMHKTGKSTLEVVLTVNGHLALELALQSLKIDGEVITTPFTFASTTHAIVRNGLKPVFCDIKEDDFTMDPEKIERLITKDTKAILPVHVYGNVCDVEAIEKIAKKHLPPVDLCRL